MATTDSSPQRMRRPQRKRAFVFGALLAAALSASVGLVAQQVPLDPASILKIPTDSWPTYHGDYSGRRFSMLTQITSDNVKNLALAWVYRLNTSQALANIGGEGPDVPPAAAN